MLQRSTIRTALSGILLLIFSFSITPKLFLHKLVAGHKDTSYTSAVGSDKVTKAGFHCNCENQVVELPFLDHTVGFHLSISRSFQIFQATADYGFQSFPHFIFGLRGPPLSD